MEFNQEERKDLQRAVVFATKAHAGQFRKMSGLPYIVHPMAVLSQISEWGITNLVIWKAALCHDILEDRPTIKIGDLVEILGDESALLVAELSFFPDKNSDMSAPMQKKRYMDSFYNKSVPALVIKVADRICNTFDFLCTDPDYAVKYWEKATTLFDAMMDREEEIVAYFRQLGLERSDAESIPAHMKYSRTTLGRMLR